MKSTGETIFKVFFLMVKIEILKSVSTVSISLYLRFHSKFLTRSTNSCLDNSSVNVPKIQTIRKSLRSPDVDWKTNQSKEYKICFHQVQ